MTWNKKTKTIAWITVGVILLIIIILIATSGKSKAQNKAKKKSGESSGGRDATTTTMDIPQNVSAPATPVAQASIFPLKKGKIGKEVEQAQIYLVKKYGARFPKFGIDGDWGSETDGNMVKFLHKNSISQDFYKSTGMDKIKTSVFV